MSVEFNEDQKSSLLYARFQSSNEQPSLVRKLISMGIAKSPEQANKILIGIIIVLLIITGVIFYTTNGKAANNPPSSQQIQNMQQEFASHPLPPQQ